VQIGPARPTILSVVADKSAFTTRALLQEFLLLHHPGGIYPPADLENLSYQYGYENYSRLEERLVQAGIRLAMVLNRIYGC
jgi:hypothetical protein